MQWTLYPTETYGIDGTLQDLVSNFALDETFFVFKNYGIDNPTIIDGKPVPDSYWYIPTPPLALINNTWEVISRGYDSEGVPFSVVYETPVSKEVLCSYFRTPKSTHPKTRTCPLPCPLYFRTIKHNANSLQADAGFVPPCLDIVSRSDKGPSKATMDAIYDGITDLHNDVLTALVKNVVKMVQNGGRTGELYPSCNVTCQANGSYPSNSK